MSKLQPILYYIRNRSNSLFLRLVAGFLCIILLLVSLTLYSISVSKQSVRKEIVKYNTLMLKNTMESYEKHMDMLNKQMHLYLSSTEVQRLQNEPKYINYPTILNEINSWVTNPYLFIDNIVLYSKPGDFVLEKGTSTDAKTMFNIFNVSKEYPLEFWQQQFDEDYNSRIFPSSLFYNQMYKDRQLSNGELIPIIYKTKGKSGFMIVVFLDAVKMYKSFHQTLNDDFIMYNDQGQALFKRAGVDPFIGFQDLRKYDSNELVLNGKYHFYTTGHQSQITFLHRVPVEEIASQTRLNITLVAILVFAIILSVIASLLMAARINNPLQRVLKSSQGMNEEGPFQSSIREFNIISHQLYDKKKTDKQLAFFNHLKAIRNNEHDSAALEFADKSFVFVLFHVTSKKNQVWEHMSLQKWLYYIKVFIENKLNRTFPDAWTFQMEHNQILSLVFIEPKNGLEDLLEGMKSTFEQDREYGNMTMAITSVYNQSKHITDAYQEAQELVGKRQLIDAAQMITPQHVSQSSIVFATDQDKEFSANLKEGNVEQLTAFMERFYAKWHGHKLAASALIRFAETLIGKINTEVSPLLIGDARVQSFLDNSGERIQDCVTVHELELLMLDWVTQAAEAVREKKEQKDPVTFFVLEYVNERYAEDLYLDVLAEKLNLSGGYLSSYFKEKTGVNIVDYINETRIIKATALLDDNRLKIQDVAEAVGYRNITSFNRMFKKYIGLTPSEFRKRPDASS
ncbi:HTH-type transcriptional regulator YesS [compost metagenome]